MSHTEWRDVLSSAIRGWRKLATMATPRYKLVDNETALGYHLVSNCVRGAWLCGRDKRTRKDYSHRKRWLVDRTLALARCFAVEIDAYAVMSNHFHLVVHYDPKACEGWSAEEVAARWADAFPPTERGSVVEERKSEARELMLGDPERLERARRTLGSLSCFMKHLKQPVARRANEEDGCKGHFFEQRFYSGALLSEKAVLAAMAYVDLNPVRAKVARRLAQCRYASISARLLENSPAALESFLRPLASGLTRDSGQTESHADQRPRIGMTLAAYIARLEAVVEAEVPTDREAQWIAEIASLAKRQRAYGPNAHLQRWIAGRGMRLREVPLPT